MCRFLEGFLGQVPTRTGATPSLSTPAKVKKKNRKVIGRKSRSRCEAREGSPPSVGLSTTSARAFEVKVFERKV